MRAIDFDLSKEQKEIFKAAYTNRALIVSVIGTANDLRWGELAELGWLEPASIPREVFHSHPKSRWNAWRITPEAGRYFDRALEQVRSH